MERSNTRASGAPGRTRSPASSASCSRSSSDSATSSRSESCCSSLGSCTGDSAVARRRSSTIEPVPDRRLRWEARFEELAHRWAEELGQLPFLDGMRAVLGEDVSTVRELDPAGGLDVTPVGEKEDPRAREQVESILGIDEVLSVDTCRDLPVRPVDLGEDRMLRKAHEVALGVEPPV